MCTVNMTAVMGSAPKANASDGERHGTCWSAAHMVASYWRKGLHTCTQVYNTVSKYSTIRDRHKGNSKKKKHKKKHKKHKDR